VDASSPDELDDFVESHAVSPPSPPSALPLEASGIGTTSLADNFAVYTLTKHYPTGSNIPPHVVGNVTEDLPTSRPPPAGYLLASSSDEDDSEEAGFADESDGPNAMDDNASDSD